MSSIWDKLFATLWMPKPNEGFSFGLAFGGKKYQSSFGRYVLQLRKTARLLRSGRAEAPPQAATAVQLGTTQLGITSRQRDHVA